MKSKKKLHLQGLALCVLALSAAMPALASGDETSPAIAAKLDLRGSPKGIKVDEMRLQRKNDTLTVQSDLKNTSKTDKVVFYRHKWLDSSGSQVGDGEVFKQVTVLGLQTVTIKGVAMHPSAVDVRLEMNIDGK